MALFLALLVAAPSAQNVLQLLQSTVKLSGVAISRDGAQVAWVEQVPTPDGPSDDESIVQVRTASGEIRRITAGSDGKPHDETSPAFSPDGASLAFLSDAEKRHQPQLYLADLSSGSVRQLTHVTGHLAAPRFGAAGIISVLFIEGAPDAQGPLKPAVRRTGVVDEQIREQRLALVAADGSAPLRQISPPDLFIYEYSWRPDAGAFAVTAAHGSGDDNWWTAELYEIDVQSGAARKIYKPSLQICEPAYSPDGKRIAFIEGLMSDAGSNGGDVFVVPADGSRPPRNLTPKLHGSAASVRWIEPGSVLFGLQIDGDSAFAKVPAEGAGKPDVLWRGRENVTTGWPVGAVFSADGRTSAALRESFEHPPEVVSGPIGAWQPLTNRNAALRSPAGSARSLHWKSERFDVQGWLLSPPQPPGAGEKAPMVVIVHGGPASAVRSAWSEQALLLASQGYYVFLPNPRGSFGQGEAFARANVKDLGHGDLRDILRGVDAAVASAPIDARRIGLFGHSYGGFMAMWAVTQTDKFAAAIASAGIANWQSYYGQNQIDQWMIPYFGKSVYEDPRVYARASPINFIRNVKTPTLVLNGERDAECPLAQGLEFWHALKALGVPTQLVVYEDEGHRIAKPEHVRDRAERIVGWFDAHLKAPQAQKPR